MLKNNETTAEQIVFNVINEILIDHQVDTKDINTSLESKLIDDLKFTSLMFAQLIMMIQDQIEYDPFSDEDSKFAISDMVTIGNLVEAYS